MKKCLHVVYIFCTHTTYTYIFSLKKSHGSGKAVVVLNYKSPVLLLLLLLLLALFDGGGERGEEGISGHRWRRQHFLHLLSLTTTTTKKKKTQESFPEKKYKRIFFFFFFLCYGRNGVPIPRVVKWGQLLPSRKLVRVPIYFFKKRERRKKPGMGRNMSTGTLPPPPPSPPPPPPPLSRDPTTYYNTRYSHTQKLGHSFGCCCCCCCKASSLPLSSVLPGFLLKLANPPNVAQQQMWQRSDVATCQS